MGFWMTILIIYGVGVMFTITLAQYMFAEEWVKNSSARGLLKLPLYIFAGFICGLAWPVMLFKDAGFREAVIDFGRIMIIFGYLACALLIVAYPVIWLWYMGGFICFIFLDRYHYKWSVKPRE